MTKLYQEIRLAMWRMPFLLRWSTGMCLAFSLFLAAAIIPFGGHVIDGKEVSYAEFWRQGGGPVFAGIGILAILLAYGFIRATGWVRLLAVMAGYAHIMLTALDEQLISWEIMITVILIGLFWPGYLFLNAGVRRYFAGNYKAQVKPARGFSARRLGKAEHQR